MYQKESKFLHPRLTLPIAVFGKTLLRIREIKTEQFFYRCRTWEENPYIRI